MVDNSKALAHRIRELFLSGTWIAGTNYKMLLSDVDIKQAKIKVDSLNSIHKLTYHINYYLEGILNVFKGGSLTISDSFSFDCPEVSSQDEWLKMQQKLYENADAFASYVEDMTDEKLNSTFVDEKYGSYCRNIEGLIEHSYYHFGQIALLKKLTNTN